MRSWSILVPVPNLPRFVGLIQLVHFGISVPDTRKHFSGLNLRENSGVYVKFSVRTCCVTCDAESLQYCKELKRQRERAGSGKQNSQSSV